MATLKQIAEIARVNISTVSKALHGSTDLNEQTVATIRRIAEELHYPIPEQETEIVVQKSGGLVGVMAPEIISPYYATMLDSLCHHLKQNDLRMQLMLSDFSVAEELRCIKNLLRMNICALVCFSEESVLSPAMQSLLSKHSTLPTILISMAEASDFCDSICVDDWQGAMLAMNHLLELGHRRIAYVGDALSHTRRQAYETALQSAGLPVRKEYIVESDRRFEACGEYGLQRLLQLPEMPTAIFASYDNVACGVLCAAQKAGLRVPEDFSLVSIDNISAAAYFNPPLTTVTEFTQDVGKLTCDLLLSKLRDNRRYVQNIKLRPALVQRGSTAPYVQTIVDTKE